MAETRSAVAACAMAAADLGFAVADPSSIRGVADGIAVRTLVPTLNILKQSGRPPSMIAARFLRSVISEPTTSAGVTPSP